MHPDAPAAFDAATVAAPTSAGVYFLLGERTDLLYIGKGANLRRRLREHAKNAGTPRLRSVREIRWECCDSPDAALVRESNLIAALRPPKNKTLPYEANWAFIAAFGLGAESGRVRLEMTTAFASGARNLYGAFPHLGPGLSNKVGIACTEGYTAVLRMIWAADASAAGRTFPAKIGRLNPPIAVDLPLRADMHDHFHAFLTGNSDDFVELIAEAVKDGPVADYMRLGLARDATRARAFFAAGPRAQRELRVRHKHPTGPMAQATVEDLYAADLRASIGEFVVPTRPAGGRETRIGWMP